MAILTSVGHAQRTRLPKVGFIRGAANPSWTAAFVDRLAEHGFVQGKSLQLNIFGTDENPLGIQATIKQLVDEQVDAIVTTGTTTTLFAKQATASIPIVFLSVSDPVGAGIVASLARPEANITGISHQQTALLGKRLQVLRELVPGLKSLGMLVNANNPAGLAEQRELTELGRSLGITITEARVSAGSGIEGAFERLGGKIEALYVFGDYLTATHRALINSQALAHRLPTMYPFKEFVLDGGLISYGPNVPTVFRRAADYVARIIAGARPGDLPIEQPTSFELVANYKTARQLGLVLPQSVLLMADTLVE